ncbi:hypothetical protein [Frankia sp. CIT1]|uniref:hypothetical protein n=1 Tax=Frankia sp. CIT1 TaxID=2880974 RepID=UPI001EF4317D|nr:hypothetical protein [Frankia sp. CIT1]
MTEYSRLVEYGLVRPSCVPPQPIRELRDLTRYRKAQIEERTREVQRLEKFLQDAGITLSSVSSSILTKSGRDILEAMIAGSTDPEVLSELARGRLRSKIPTLRQALNGFFSGHHGLIIGEILAKVDYLDEAIDRLSTEIDRVIPPFEEKVALLDTIPGVDRCTAQCLLAESGSRSALPRSGPLRTVRAPRRRTRLKQAARALRVEARASCVCGLGARGGRRHVSSGFGSFPACHSRGDGRGTRRRLPVGPRSATSVPTPKETGVAGRRQADDRDRAGSGRPAG